MKKIKSIRAVFETAVHPVLIVTGTPGTGKSTAISRVASEAQILNISELVKRKGLHDGYDPEFDTFLVNDRKTRKELRKIIPELRKSGPVVIECHSLGIFDADDLESMVTRVLVLTCSTESLYDRLQSRGYSPNKISENVECEIMRVCADEAAEVFRGPGVLKEMPNDTEEDGERVVEAIREMINLK